MAALDETVEMVAADGARIVVYGRGAARRRAGLIERNGMSMGLLGSDRFPTVAAVREHFGVGTPVIPMPSAAQEWRHEMRSDAEGEL